jgi:anti-sigma-K factor RskA
VSVQSHDLHLLTGVYAVDALTGDELDEFEKHLEQCPTCAEEVRGLRETAARLGLATAIEPPPSMREQVLDATKRVRQLPPSGVRLITAADGRRPRRRLIRRLSRPIAVTAMAAAIIVLAVLQVGTRHQLQQAQSANQTIASVLSASDAHIQLGSSTVGGTVTAVISRHDREAVITASGMPTPSGARVYQLWVMSGTSARSVGLLPGGSAGATAPVLADDVQPGDQLAITIEPAGGTRQPTTNPIAAIHTRP